MEWPDTIKSTMLRIFCIQKTNKTNITHKWVESGDQKCRSFSYHLSTCTSRVSIHIRILHNIFVLRFRFIVCNHLSLVLVLFSFLDESKGKWKWSSFLGRDTHTHTHWEKRKSQLFIMLVLLKIPFSSLGWRSCCFSIMNRATRQKEFLAMVENAKTK